MDQLVRERHAQLDQVADLDGQQASVDRPRPHVVEIDLLTGQMLSESLEVAAARVQDQHLQER